MEGKVKMKNYKLELPERFKNKKQEVLEYLTVCHYVDEIFTAGACGIILGIDKIDFRYKIIPNYELRNNVLKKRGL
jgi:hypothetical protein